MKILCKTILFLFIALLYQCKTQSLVTQEKIDTIDSFIKQQENEIGFSGSVLISEKNNILIAKGYGLADREQKIFNDASTIFEIASITKLFTVVAILQLAETERLFLNDGIDKYLGDFESPKNQATIHHLLLHTAGLVPRGFQLDYETKHGFIESIKNAPLESVPGKKYRYTNAGYILLAAIIEQLSQQSYEDYLIENIFKPLSLTNTIFGFKDSVENIANGYAGKSLDSLKVFKTSEYVWGDNGPSGILTNVTDLHLFLQGLDDNKILKNEYLQKMYFEQMEGEAYGFHLLDKPKIGKVLARGGGLPHFESQVAWYKHNDIKVIILINNHLRTRQPVWDGIEEILFN